MFFLFINPRAGTICLKLAYPRVILCSLENARRRMLQALKWGKGKVQG